MHDGESAPVEVHAAQWERLDGERHSVRLTGTWHDTAAATHPLTLVLEADGERHSLPAVPRPRPTIGPDAPRFDARFTIPGEIAGALRGPITLFVGDTPVAIPALEPAPHGDPEPHGDHELLAPLREELAQRATVEARLRAELAALRAQVDIRQPAAERLDAVRRELAEELERVRTALAVHEGRRSEVESRAMVLAAELSDAQGERELLGAELEARQAECQHLRSQVAELESELTAARGEVSALRSAELSARAGREAALAEVAALHDELERLAAGGALAVAAADPELERAEALLAEARALTDSLD